MLLELIENTRKDINAILDDLIVSIKVAQGKPVAITLTDKKMLIVEFEAGRSVADVANYFPNYTINQISAVKAHCTMHTYKKEKQHE